MTAGRRSISEEQWRDLLVNGDRAGRILQWLFRRLPSSPRCKQCFAPFGGIGGKFVGAAGFRPSRKNPRLCAHCLEELPLGGAEVDIAVLFADVRGSTTKGEQLSPSEFAALMNRFYRSATDVLVMRGALVDKMIGDEVMALFIPGFTGHNYRARAVEAAVELLRAVGFAPGKEAWLPVGIGIHSGVAFVGNVGDGEVTDFTALGDTVNTAARLQGQAGPGEIAMSETIYQEVAANYPNLERQVVALRGRAEPLVVRMLKPTAL